MLDFSVAKAKSTRFNKNLPVLLETPFLATNPRFWTAKKNQKYIYIYIYIYGCGLVCRRKFCHFWCFFLSVIAKRGQKEMLQICPISLFTFFDKNSPKMAWDCSPKHFLKKGHWDCSPRPLSWFIWVSKLIFLLIWPPKTLQIAENVKHIKLVLSKKGKNLRRQTSPQAYIYIERERERSL